MIQFEPFEWKSTPPADIPFTASKVLTRVRFLGRCSDYRVGDTWYPTWGDDDVLYSPFTDGTTKGLKVSSNGYTARGGVQRDENGNEFVIRRAMTGHGTLAGSDPLNLQIEALGVEPGDPYPYGGRYPCGSLMHNGIWYYGTYCLGPYAEVRYKGIDYNWPWMGPFVGFRVSRDKGRTWTDCPYDPLRNLFDENGLCGSPVKIGSPHFVDFGRNMEHSPDGKAYLVAHGSDWKFYPVRNFPHLSWITGDQIYLLRVTPSQETINDPKAYEFFGGLDSTGRPIWTAEFERMQPLLEWPNNMGCVTVTYNAPLGKFLMAVTDGGVTCARMNSYILESDELTGPWRLVSYLKEFGEQAYFLNFPSKFISSDGHSMWLCYSGNFAPDWNDATIEEKPPGSHYGLVLQEIELS